VRAEMGESFAGQTTVKTQTRPNKPYLTLTGKVIIPASTTPPTPPAPVSS